MSNLKNITHQAVAQAGGASKLGSQLIGRDGKPLSRQAVEQWVVIPPRHVLKVEELTGISRHVLRPDIYGPEPIRPLSRRRKARDEAMSAA